MGAGAVWAGAPPRFSLVLIVIRKVMATIMMKMLRMVEVTLPLQAREEQVESLLVLVVVVTTALVIIFVMRTAIMMVMVKRPAPQAFARPGDFVLFLLGMLMFT